MRFFQKRREKYEFQIADDVSVELTYLSSPFYSTLRVITGGHKEECAIDVNPDIAKRIMQYFNTNRRKEVANELFVKQLMAWGLVGVVSHVNTALSPKDAPYKFG